MISSTSLFSFCFWNVNGLTPRLSKDKHLIRDMLSNHSPDVIFLSEVRMKVRSC